MSAILDSGNRREWSLYKHTSPSGKVYIGIAQNPKHRWRAKGNGYKGSNRIYYAIQKYGWDNFKHEIIREGLTREEASLLEKEYITKYKATNPEYGYNLKEGGYDGILCKESAEKKRMSLMGHSVSKSVRDRLAQSRSIEVICLDTLQVFDSAKKAAEHFGISAACVGKCCNGLATNANGLRFAKLKDYQNLTIPVFKSKPRGKKVLCIETDTIYKNQSEAARIYGVTSQAISHACTGKVTTCANKHWKFLED